MKVAESRAQTLDPLRIWPLKLYCIDEPSTKALFLTFIDNTEHSVRPLPRSGEIRQLLAKANKKQPTKLVLVEAIGYRINHSVELCTVEVIQVG